MKILAIIHGSKSHLNANLKLFSYLEEEGHQIEICTSSFLSGELNQYHYSAHFINLMPFGSGFEERVFKKNRYPYFKNLSLRANDFFYRNRQFALRQVLCKVRPDLIYLDILYATDAILLYPFLQEKGIKLVFFSTKPSLDRTSSAPPVNSPVIPKSEGHVNLLWRKYNWKKKCKGYIDSIRFFFHNDYAIIKEKAAAVDDFSLEHPLVWRNVVGIRFENFPQLILLPEAFEFQPVFARAHQHYIGFNFYARLENRARTKNFVAIKNLIEIQKDLGKKIIYCSFGTIHQEYEKRILNFLNHLFVAARYLGGFYLIVSLRKEVAQHISKPIPENVEIFDFVPQLTVLKHADLFITHGGINSIKEAIHINTPLLVYPVNPNWDQPGNAARVQYHGIGLKGDIQKVNVKELSTKIEILIGKQSRFRNNLENLKSADEAYSKARFLNLFHDLMGFENDKIRRAR